MSAMMLLRKAKLLVATAPLFAAMLFFYACAEGSTARFTQPLPSTQRVFIDNTNLTVKDFFSAYMSNSVEERRYAELYLLGVMDATEGKSWCDYRSYKTTTLSEEIYLGFKALDESKQSERAAHAITSILAKKFPCRIKQ